APRDPDRRAHRGDPGAQGGRALTRESQGGAARERPRCEGGRGSPGSRAAGNGEAREFGSGVGADGTRSGVTDREPPAAEPAFEMRTRPGKIA
ncbi:MAG: hypothetical protein ABI610_09260, partial [Acidobacteriota bacterium]